MNPMTDPDETKRAAQPAKPEPPVAEPGVAPSRSRRGLRLGPAPVRWSAKRKAEIALHRLRGEALDTLSRQSAVPVPRLEDWRRQALAGMEHALQMRAAIRWGQSADCNVRGER
jgi:hypothetical protein